MFSCEICEIFKNIFFIEHLWWLLLVLHPEQDLISHNEKEDQELLGSFTNHIYIIEPCVLLESRILSNLIVFKSAFRYQFH